VGPLRSVMGYGELSLEIADGETVRSVLKRVLEASGGRGREYIEGFENNPENLVVSVDGEVVRDPNHRVKGGETILLTPPLAGGSQPSVRCLNCSTRIEVQPQAEEAKCSSCGTSYLITWISPTQPKIRRVAT